MDIASLRCVDLVRLFCFIVLVCHERNAKKMGQARHREHQKISGRKLLVMSALFFQLENWLVLIADLFVSNSQSSGEDTSAWSKMLWSLLLITVFEALYLTEAIWAVAKDRSRFNVFKLCVVIVSALLLMSLMYYGTVETIICNVFLVLLLIVECMSLLRDKKRNKTL